MINAGFYRPSEHYEARYKAYLSDAGWLLAAVDACSFIDALFEHSAHDGPSLLDQWGAKGFGGHVALKALNADRDVALETDLRGLRSKIAAHLDTYRQTSDHCRQVNCTPPPHKLDGAAT